MRGTNIDDTLTKAIKCKSQNSNKQLESCGKNSHNFSFHYSLVIIFNWHCTLYHWSVWLHVYVHFILLLEHPLQAFHLACVQLKLVLLIQQMYKVSPFLYCQNLRSHTTSCMSHSISGKVVCCILGSQNPD